MSFHFGGRGPGHLVRSPLTGFVGTLGDLGILSLSATTFTRGASTSGTILGATALSTITASGLPSGLTINSAARTWAWDGSGSGSSNSTLTLTETLAGYSNTPHDTVISYSIIVGGSLATPTLTNSSALGAAPLVLSASSTDYTAGLYLQLQIDQTSNAFSNITQNLVALIDGASWAALDEAIGLVTPPGQYWARVRVVRDNESGLTTVTGTDPDTATISFLADVSSWSTTFTDTINASTALLSTTNGTNKYALLTVSGSPALQFSSASGNSYGSVRSTVEQASDYAQYELTITSGASGDILFGIDDGTTNFASSSLPGYTTSTGICVELNVGAYVTLLWNSSGNSVNLVNNVAGTIAVGDIFTLVYKISTASIEVYRTRSGVTTQMGSTQTGMPALTHHYAWCGINNTTSGATVNFGGSTYAKTPGSGVAALWA